MVTSQYPHQLHYDGGQYATVQKDANGRFIQPTQATSPQVLNCRAEVSEGSSGVRLTVGTDGQQTDFLFTVYLPSGILYIPAGTAVEIREGGSLIGQGKVKRFNRGTFHNRLWI